MDRDVWALYDTRNGKRLAMSSYLSKEQGEWDIANMKKRDAQLRMRTHDLLPHIGVIELTQDTWDAKPGDIIDGRSTA
jgi:hypothetical protein